MIDTLLSIIGYSGSDPVITYLCVATALILTVCLAYRLFDFIFSLITSITGRGKNINL